MRHNDTICIMLYHIELLHPLTVLVLRLYYTVLVLYLQAKSHFPCHSHLQELLSMIPCALATGQPVNHSQPIFWGNLWHLWNWSEVSLVESGRKKNIFSADFFPMTPGSQENGSWSVAALRSKATSEIFHLFVLRNTALNRLVVIKLFRTDAASCLLVNFVFKEQQVATVNAFLVICLRDDYALCWLLSIASHCMHCAWDDLLLSNLK